MPYPYSLVNIMPIIFKKIKDAESKSGNAQPGTMPWPWVEQNIITTTFYYESEVLLYWPEENIHLIKQ